MTPYYADDWLTVYAGDCRAVLATLPAESVHCVVTSPPYWGLRDYGTAAWEGGDADCDHEPNRESPSSTLLGGKATQGQGRVWRDCPRCGAVRIDSQLGLEPTPEQYVANLVAVFREVKRVLRSDGTCWLNLGDSYASATVGMRGVRSDSGQARPSEGPMSEVLSPDGSQAMVSGASGTGEGPRSGVASSPRSTAERSGASTSPGEAGAGDGSLGREVPLLWSDRADIPDAGSRSERRPQGPEAGASSADGSGGGRGLPAGAVSSSLLELQRSESDGRLPTFGSLKPKDLVGIPWMVAFALRADGWYLRSDVIWSKPNPMPESVTDRPTKSHEYLFLLAKSERYFFDAEAVAETSIWPVGSRADVERGGFGGKWAEQEGHEAFRSINPTRNIRSVWTVATAPYPGAHFATFPPKLIEPCIKAGCPESGTVLDPFAGSGTTGMVAQRLSRRAVLIDLNPAYLVQCLERNGNTVLGLVG